MGSCHGFVFRIWNTRGPIFGWVISISNYCQSTLPSPFCVHSKYPKRLIVLYTVYTTLQAAESTVSDSLKEYLEMPESQSLGQLRPADGADQNISLIATVAVENADMDALVSEWEYDLNTDDTLNRKNISFTISRRSAPSRIIIVTPDSRLPHCVLYIARREEVLWLEEVQEAKTMNSRATKIVQGGAANMVQTVWDAGITGRGQIIGVADSGLDVTSYFFNDASNPVVFCETFAWGQCHRILLYALKV
jgi:hypothetical protein